MTIKEKGAMLMMGKQPLYLIKNGQVVNEEISGGFGAYPYRTSYHPTNTSRSPDVTYSGSYIQIAEGSTGGSNANYGVFSTNGSIDVRGYSTICARIYSNVKAGTYNQLILGSTESLTNLFHFVTGGYKQITHGNSSSYPTLFDGIFTFALPSFEHQVYLLFYLGVKSNENLHRIYDLWLE